MKEEPPVNVYAFPGVWSTPFTKITRTASRSIAAESGEFVSSSKLRSSPT